MGKVNSFVSQYISLVLIITVFIIASSSKIHKTRDTFYGEERKIIGRYIYEDLFKGGETAPSKDKLSGLIYVLKNHDINALIEVAGERHISIARSVELYRQLLAAGVPPEAAEIVSIDESGTGDATTVELYSEAGEEG